MAKIKSKRVRARKAQVKRRAERKPDPKPAAEVKPETAETKDKGGRPTKLTEGLVKALEDEFLPWCRNQTMEKNIIMGGMVKKLMIPEPPTEMMMEDWIENKFKDDPIIQGKINVSSFQEWEKGNGELNERFSTVVYKRKKIYEEMLAKNALSETYPGRFAQFLLEAKCGYRSRSDITSGDKPLAGVTSKAVAERLKRINDAHS